VSSTRNRFRRDEPDREAIRTDLDSNLLVEAAAGTGKTTSLVERMLALVREGKAPVDRICAVTFTVKAAAQLKERFQLGLEKAIPAETDPVRRARLSDALEGIDRGFIGTIHSFCARLLRERPVEAGVDPEFVELDETEDVLLREEAWERYKQTLFLESQPILGELADYGMTIDLLREAFQCLASNPEVRPAVAGRRDEPRFDRERGLVLAFLAEAEKHLPPRAPDAKPDQLRRKISSALRLKDILDLDRTAALVSLLEKFQGKGKPVQRDWGNAVVAKRLEAEFEALATNVVAPALVQWREFLYPVVIEAVLPAVETFRRLRRERGVLDFADLLLFARDLLRDHPDARREFRKRFTPILVDEFQDTDPIQAEVLLYLTGADVHEKRWWHLAPEPGSLFVVGDPKQSIYRFRRADIETYERVRERIVASGGRVLNLTTNFRSCPEICDWVNATFSRIFPATASREQAADAPLVPERATAGGFSGAVQLVVSGKTRESVAELDAVRIASWIRAAIDARVEIPSADSRAAEPGDFLILFRYKKMMEIYARELELRAVPYEIAGGGAFSESEDLHDFLPLLEAIVDPDDPVSLAATLRGPLFGVDDDALYRFHRSGGRFHLFAPPPAGSDPRILRAIDVLRESFDLSRRLPPAAALASIAGNVGVVAHGGARELGGTRAGNLLKAVSIARMLSSDGESFASIVRHLRQLATASDTEEMSVQPGAVRAVRLMTLHRAKGLEAPIVFLADPGGEWDAPIAFCIARETEPPEAWLRVLRPDRGDRPSAEEVARPVGWSGREDAERRFQEAENDRLLYVAATRAADLLVVSTCGPAEKRSPWSKLARAIDRPLPALPERSRPVTPEPGLPDLPRELADFRRQVDARRIAAAAESYRIVPVTKLAHDAAEATPFRARTGRGMSWGRVIHRLLEGAMKDPSLDLSFFATNLLAEEERSADDRDAAVELARAVIGSPLWLRALAARRRFTEVPFALRAPAGELGLAGGPDETILQGAIDLAFEEDSGWTIVDYKSDTVAGNLPELVAFYKPQIELYRSYWEKLTGRPTKAGLFFVQTGEEVWP
jgi:ATP-dependent helicase/nuclease subunit A